MQRILKPYEEVLEDHKESIDDLFTCKRLDGQILEALKDNDTLCITKVIEAINMVNTLKHEIEDLEDRIYYLENVRGLDDA